MNSLMSYFLVTLRAKKLGEISFDSLESAQVLLCQLTWSGCCGALPSS